MVNSTKKNYPYRPTISLLRDWKTWTSLTSKCSTDYRCGHLDYARTWTFVRRCYREHLHINFQPFSKHGAMDALSDD